MVTIAEVVAQELKAAGVRVAFGVTGEGMLPLLDAMRRLEIRYVLARHENAAGFMADAMSLLSDTPIVVLSTQGPGVTNTMTAVAQSSLDHVPIIFISTSPPHATLNSVRRQAVPQNQLLGNLTKGAWTVHTRDALTTVRTAMDVARESVPGPVYLNIPVDVLGAEATDDSGRVHPSRVATIPDVDAPEFGNISRKLEAAVRPLVIVGGEAAMPAASSAVRKWLMDSRIPTVTTYKGKGVVSESEAIALGAIGLSAPLDEIQLRLARQADTVLVIGVHSSELNSYWRDHLGPEAVEIHLASFPHAAELFRPDYEYVGDIGRFLEMMPPRSKATGWPRAVFEDHRKAIAGLMAPNMPSKGLSPSRLVAALRDALPDDTVATVDTGSHRIVVSHVWKCYEPRTLLQSIGLGTMGYGLPSAIGAKLARPSSPVVCFSGDAGIEMVAGELGVLRETALPIIVVVFSDGVLSRIRVNQREWGYEDFGVEFQGADYVQLAGAYGGHGEIISSETEVSAVVTDALQRKVFTLIEARIDPSEYQTQM